MKVNDFIEEYNKWANQKKFENVRDVIKPISTTWQKRLQNSLYFNLWGLLLGPFYGMILLINNSTQLIGTTFLTGAEVALLLFFPLPFSLVFILLMHLFFCLLVNKMYIRCLKYYKKEKQDFSPLNNTIEWFNVSAIRLIGLTILSGGLYLVYWFYRQTKAIKVSQKDTSFSPGDDAFFWPVKLGSVFRRIDCVCEHKTTFLLTNIISGFVSLIFLCYWYYLCNLLQFYTVIVNFIQRFSQGLNTTDIVIILSRIRFSIVLFIYIISASIVNHWRYKISLYCKKNNMEEKKTTDLGESLCFLFGIVILIGRFNTDFFGFVLLLFKWF